MLKAIAIDDEPPALRVIEHFCKQSELIELIKSFTDADMASDFIHKNQPDLLFLDIQMPLHNGLKFYNNLTFKPMVLFTTAFSEYAIEGFNIDAVDYLLKPYTEERFLKAIQKAYEKWELAQKTKNHLTLRTSYSIKSIVLDEILYIESFDDYITIHFRNADALEIRMTLKKMIELLPKNKFLRVHRSYIVSIQYIVMVRNKQIFIDNCQIPIGSKYEREFLAHFRK